MTFHFTLMFISAFFEHIVKGTFVFRIVRLLFLNNGKKIRIPYLPSHAFKIHTCHRKLMFNHILK